MERMVLNNSCLEWKKMNWSGKMRKKTKKFLTVYTVAMTESSPKRCLCHNTIGSYLSRDDAIRELADYILERLELIPALRGAFFDGHHGDELRRLAIKGGLTSEECDGLFCDNKVCGLAIPDGVKKAIRPYLIDCIGGDGCYIIGGVYVNSPEFRFDIDENDIECRDGLQLWTCIRYGRDDENHDPEFENAFPEVFLSEDNAIRRVIGDLREFLKGSTVEEIKSILSDAKESIIDRGHFEFALNDTHTVYWDVWSTPLDIGQGSGKIRRI